MDAYMIAHMEVTKRWSKTARHLRLIEQGDLILQTESGEDITEAALKASRSWAARFRRQADVIRKSISRGLKSAALAELRSHVVWRDDPRELTESLELDAQADLGPPGHHVATVPHRCTAPPTSAVAPRSAGVVEVPIAA